MIRLSNARVRRGAAAARAVPRPGLVVALLVALAGCTAGGSAAGGATATGPVSGEPGGGEPGTGAADVVAVEVTGEPGDYAFTVTVRSPDTGCERYADFWEVVGTDGDLLYRRVLAHSHVDEQPFTRGGGPVPAAAGDRLVVRAHMSSGGYGGTVAVGTPAGGFSITEGDPDLAPGLATASPTPEGCAF
ncbi:MAG: hypothetical protein ACFCVG_07255 [Kineosporiaceae bacterium]